MKRSRLIARKKQVARTKWLKRTIKKIPAINKAACRRRKVKYDIFMKSPEWATIREASLKRAGYQCEFHGGEWNSRCPSTSRLQCHHLTYSRWGGRELPGDLQVLCAHHHRLVESEKGGTPLWKRAQ